MIRSTVPKPADRDDWLAVRRPFFNASYAAVLFDQHPYVTAGDVATIKLTGKEQDQTRAMDRGRRLEDVIARWWADENDCVVCESDVLFVAGRVMATVDRIAEGGDMLGVPVEIKTTNTYAPEPLAYWLDQCQAIMLCTAARQLALVWFDSTLDLQWRMVAANDYQQAQIADGAERFMAAIDLGMVPDWVGLSYANQAELHPHGEGGKDLGDQGYNLVVALATIRRARLAAEREEERIKAEIGGLLGDAESGLFAGREVVRWSNVKGSRQLDAKRLALEKPELVADYFVDRPATRRMVPIGMEEEAA